MNHYCHYAHEGWNVTACFKRFKRGWFHLYIEGKKVESPHDVTDEKDYVTCPECLKHIKILDEVKE